MCFTRKVEKTQPRPRFSKPPFSLSSAKTNGRQNEGMQRVKPRGSCWTCHKMTMRETKKQWCTGLLIRIWSQIKQNYKWYRVIHQKSCSLWGVGKSIRIHNNETEVEYNKNFQEFQSDQSRWRQVRRIWWAKNTR